jgi:thiamine transport system substrate-binding protein
MHPHKIVHFLTHRIGGRRQTIVTRLGILLLVTLLTGCQSGPRTLVVMTHDDFYVSESVLQQFEKDNNVKVSVLKSGDAGAALNKAILTKGAPLADVFYGVDTTFLTRALQADIFERYDSPRLKDIPVAFRLDDQNRALPVDYGDVCINYDRAYFAAHNLPLPQSLEDLTSPQYRGLLVVENPATSSPGLAFLLVTVKHFGPEGFLEFWKSLRENEVQVVDGWGTAYRTNFSGSSGRGAQPMVVSYGSSPVAEIVFAETPPAEPPTASLVGPDMCFRQIEFAGILVGTPNRGLAEKFVDFLLSDSFQEDMPLQMFVFPVDPQAALPDSFVQYAQIPDQPVTLPPDEISAHREEWINSWKQTVLK